MIFVTISHAIKTKKIMIEMTS